MMSLSWQPPGKNCGACGVPTCDVFLSLLESGERKTSDCPFSQVPSSCSSHGSGVTPGVPDVDIFGNPLDFVLMPFPGEVSAHKILLPFRPDMVEKMDIIPGDILTGRPAGAGCPVQHVVRVISASRISGLITCHVVGPAYSRGKDVKDLEAYHMIGFEGIAQVVHKVPEFGRRMRFLPGYCMMNLAHTGVVNLVASTHEGLRIRVEDIRL